MKNIYLDCLGDMTILLFSESMFGSFRDSEILYGVLAQLIEQWICNS